MTVVAKIIIRVDTKSEDNHQNIARQEVIGVKEETVVGISKHVSNNVINNVLRKANSNTKKANKC